MAGYFGTQMQQRLQAQAEASVDFIRVTPGACQTGRTMGCDDPEGLGWERIIEFLEETPALDGPVNAASPHPVDNAAFMATVRRVLGAKVGPPMPRWMLELGAIGIRTETELVLKSRWVLPEKLTAAGFTFRYPDLEEAVRASFAVTDADPRTHAA